MTDINRYIMTEANNENDIGQMEKEPVSNFGRNIDDVKPIDIGLEQKASNQSHDVQVYVQVNLDNCPRKSLSSEDLRGVKGIIHRYEHLKLNVKNVDFGDYRTYRSSTNDRYDHSLWVILTVNTIKLWENARSYIWKHLGRNEWKIGDETQLTMNRIHVKT